MTASTPGQAAQALALLDEVLEDVAHVVGGNPDWIHREMLNDYSERAEALAAQEPHAAPGPLRARVGAVAHGLETAAGPSLTRAQQIKAGIARTLREILDETKQEEPQPAPELAAAQAALARVLSWFAGNGTRREASATRAQLAHAYQDGGLTVPEELRRFL